MTEGKNLVIVESPAKAGTIQKFLGKDFVVKSSFGHIRDLHDNELSIDTANGFKPEYVIPADKKKVVAELKKAAKAIIYAPRGAKIFQKSLSKRAKLLSELYN